jgi:spoIIIJ-associated protein
MSQEQTTLEIIAPTVEEAVSNGLSQLGLPREAVEVEVLDQGSRGLFGLGGRQARVRIKILAVGQEVEIRPARTPAAVEEKPQTPPVRPNTAPVETDETLKVSSRVVRDLLERMKVKARVEAHYSEAEEAGEHSVVMVEILGDDLSILIGRKSETLNALQYLSSLIVGKELGSWVPLIIDVQGYRSRRERQLRQLARKMAEQAVATGRRQVLEPMPANERRLIHLELRDHAAVGTESIGDEPSRKVTIFLKK